MDDDAPAPREPYPLTKPGATLSRTPSWVMLGFILGALFVYALMRREAAPPATVQVQMLPPPKPAPREKATLSTIEAVFAVWGEHATWSGDTTEVALWNKEEKAYTDYYEVRRIGGILYFRSIPELTRRIIRHGKELPDSPLQFTETEEQYREWLEHGRRERPPEGPPPRLVRPGNP
ncbi:MAG: hypothetical protein HZC55_27710 [Verrucomicrobia bacterium]|nr:hypothetical protein [Verrucomicrobiota bacterium]